MTEQEWLASVDPIPMLEFLRGKASERKLRLFAAACCRRIFPLADECSRAAVEVVERVADGKATDDDLESAWDAAGNLAGNANRACRAAACFTASKATGLAAVPVESVARAAVWAAGPRESHGQAVLLRCLFGQSSSSSIALDPAWLTSTVTSLAQGIYDERAFDRLPILADALEDAGCTTRTF
jgi:hypothetical protein